MDLQHAVKLSLSIFILLISFSTINSKQLHHQSTIERYYVTQKNLARGTAKSAVVKQENMIILDTKIMQHQANKIQLYKGTQLIMEDDFSDLEDIRYYELDYGTLVSGTYTIILLDNSEKLSISSYKIKAKQPHFAATTF